MRLIVAKAKLRKKEKSHLIVGRNKEKCSNRNPELVRSVIRHEFLHGQRWIEISRLEMLQVDLIASSGKTADF